ncbi:hypothetical protein, partial [Thiolapillus sp.]|uniref:hypothetical protein n=1 Tax=Thiolapillus sp. TaxID=2017437 RepID=UPI003AF9DA1E
AGTAGHEPRWCAHGKTRVQFHPDRVHWASSAGRNFTDRQRIRRRAANWGKNCRALPRAEHLAVLAAMMAVEAGDAAGSG